MDQRPEFKLSDDSETDKTNQSTLVAKKFTLRFKSFHVGKISNYKNAFIRTQYIKKFILPQSFTSVYIIPTFAQKEMIFLIHISKHHIIKIWKTDFLASERFKKFKMVDLVASFLNWNPEDETAEIE